MGNIISYSIDYKTPVLTDEINMGFSILENEPKIKNKNALYFSTNNIIFGFVVVTIVFILLLLFLLIIGLLIIIIWIIAGYLMYRKYRSEKNLKELFVYMILGPLWWIIKLTI